MAVSANARGGNKQGRGDGQKMTPEIYFARKLAANDKKTRDNTLKKLKKWLGARSTVPDAFSEEELMKLWRGLFYCMWMSDKPLIQEDLAESISSLLHSVSCRSTALIFAKVALKTMAREWSGIDHWRMEKFMMFIRRLVRHCLMYLASSNWDLEEVEAFSSMLSDDIINANKSTAELKVPIGFQLHIINIFAEELAKVGKEELPSPVIVQILKPFVKCLATTNDGRLKKEITQHVFIHLIKQSDAVLDSEDEEEEEAEEASGEAEAEEEEEEAEEESKRPAVSSKDKAEAGKSTEDEDEETADLLNDDEQGDDDMEIDFDAKDPRAGGINVVLPQLRPDFSKLADMVFSEASEKTVRTKNRKPMYQLVKKFRDVANGVNPLKVRLPDEGSGLTPDFMKKAARKLIKEEVKAVLEQDTERRSYKSATKTKTKGSKRRKLEDSALGEDDGSDASDDGSDMLDDEEDDEDVDDEDVDEEEDALDDEDVDEEDDEEAEDEDLDEEDSEDLDDDLDDEETVDDEEEQTKHKQQQAKKRPSDQKKVVASKVATKRKDQPQGETCSASASSGQFEVNDDWDAESTEESSPAHMAQLKKKLKARKKMQPWTETPTKGEIEIVISNKKYQGSVQMKPAPQAKEHTQQDCTPANGSRRVNFILDKNTAQEPKDYQESVRKSPGIPHDPHRQPPSGGVLKRCTAANQKQSQPMKRRRDPSARLYTRN